LWSDALLLAGKDAELKSLKMQNDSLFKTSSLRSDSISHNTFCKLWYSREFPESFEHFSSDLIEVAMVAIQQKEAYSEIEKIQQVIERVSDTEILKWLVFLQKRNELKLALDCIQLVEERSKSEETERRLQEIERFQAFREPSND